MLRVATTVRRHNGSRAVGTTIDWDNPVFQTVRTGKIYRGRNKIVDDWCATQLEGMRAWTTGYTYVIDSAGKIVLHPRAAVGEDASRHAPVAEILKKREGSMRYGWDDTLIIASPDGVIRNCNPAICSLLGYKEDELIGKSMESVLGEDARVGGPILDEVIRKGLIRNREVTYATADGRAIPMLLSASLMYGGSGGFEGVVCVAQDITIRKQAEENLAWLGMAVEQTGEAVVITDPEGTILYVNPSFERLSGYGSDEVLGKNPRILKSGKQSQEFYQSMWNTLKQGKVWSGRLVNRNKEGNLFQEYAVISPVRDASGRIVNYVGVKRDLTHEIEMEEQLRQSQKMEAIGKLAGGVAHDFNNLLTVITGYCELILSGLPKHGPWQHEIEGIKNAADRAAAVTRQFLAFSRKQVFQMKIVNMNSIVANLDGMLRRLIGEDIDLQAAIQDNLWNVKIDPAQIEQAIVNIVVNARDAMPEGGKLTIETANVMLDEMYTQTHLDVEPGPYVMIAITDTGCGMDEAIRIGETYKGPIDLLVTDVVMPQVNGRELARRMLASRPGIKVIYISGYTEDAIIHHGVLEPGMHFVQKPFRPSDLVRKVREVLDAPDEVKA